MDNLVSLLQAIGSAAVNAEVKAKILELVQSWAGATEGRYELNYIGEVYKTLQREGYQFPPRVSVASSMIDSSAVSMPISSSRECMLTVPIATRMERLRRLHAVPDSFHLYQSKASLSQLWKLLRSTVLKQNHSLASSRHSATSSSRRWMLH